MGVTYVDSTTIAVVAGQTYRVAINAPPKGTIVRAQCIQTSGSKTAYSFSFFNSAQSCPPGQVATAGDPLANSALEYQGQIGPTRSVSANQDRYYLSDGSTDGGWTPVGPYINQDGGVSTAQGKLYMKFVAGGTATYDIFLTIQTLTG